MEDVKITIRLKNIKTLLANANVSLNTTLFGFVTIKGFQIWKSTNFNSRIQQAINITPPSKPSFGHYVQLVFFEDIKLWYELESQIHSAYIKELNKSKSLETEEVDVDQLPI